MTDVVTIAAGVGGGALVATLYAGVRQRNEAAVVNIVAAIGVTLLPTLIAALFHPPGWSACLPELTLWIAVAGFLHSLGMLGLYESTSWWDHLTHAVSAALAAALLYAGLLVAVASQSGPADVPLIVPVVTVGALLVLGIAWELLELVARDVGRRYDIEPVLVHYGWWDTGLDMVFDVVGALLVVVIDVRLFVPLFDPFPHLTRTVLLAGAVACLASVLLAALYVAVGGEDVERE